MDKIGTEKPSENEGGPQQQAEKQVKVVVMRLITEVEAQKRRVVAPTRDIIALKGNGDTNMFCGKCRNFLVQEVKPERIQGVVVQCFRCKSFNIYP